MAGYGTFCASAWFSNHRFEPRYEDAPVARIEVHAGDDSTVNVDVPTSGRVYVRDVCVRCGATVERQK